MADIQKIQAVQDSVNSVIKGKEDECSAKISELKNLEIDLSEFKFSIEEFEKLELSVSDMYGILPLITD